MIITAESASSFPDAPRTFYATEEMLGDWCGPVRLGGHAGVIVGYANDLPATEPDDALACAFVYMQAEKKGVLVPSCVLQLDPLEPQVQTLLRARLESRCAYFSGEDWKDAGLLACGVAGQPVYGILEFMARVGTAFTVTAPRHHGLRLLHGAQALPQAQPWLGVLGTTVRTGDRRAGEAPSGCPLPR